MSVGKIGIISATEFELTPFLNKMTITQTTTKALLQIHEGFYHDISVVSAFCGVCKVNAAIAAQIMIDVYNVDEIVMIGVAGAIDSRLRILDTIISNEIVYHDVADEVLTHYHPWMKHPYFTADQALLNQIVTSNSGDETVLVGKMVTGEAFIDQDGREEIIEKHNPQCVDMETASVAHVCYVNQIPFVAIRSMSDTPQESGNSNFAKYASAAAEKSVQVLCRYLETKKEQ
ncbi:MAG: 5'-methylthioadenosine/adenosylhomocysteine nucleosidase [Eubacteriales bacterium]|nr:5'-methylthioadenosine/adenosylhomocysteine nucleosidase [Eubacteriales bacterium]